MRAHAPFHGIVGQGEHLPHKRRLGQHQPDRRAADPNGLDRRRLTAAAGQGQRVPAGNRDKIPVQRFLIDEFQLVSTRQDSRRVQRQVDRGRLRTVHRQRVGPAPRSVRGCDLHADCVYAHIQRDRPARPAGCHRHVIIDENVRLVILRSRRHRDASHNVSVHIRTVGRCDPFKGRCEGDVRECGGLGQHQVIQVPVIAQRSHATRAVNQGLHEAVESCGRYPEAVVSGTGI